MHDTEPTTTMAAAVAGTETRNATALDAAAELILACLRADGLIYSAGAGHSLGAVGETFYRAGGLAPVFPLYHPELLPLHGAAASTAAERRSGLAAAVLADSELGPSDVLVVFSNSGVNPYPVELAATARTAGVPVIAVTSVAASEDAPRRAGTTLAATATVVLDTGVPPGDAVYPPEQPRTAAVSSILNACLWNLLLARVVDAGARQDLRIPLWRSANTHGGDEANAGLLAHYRTRVPALR